MPAEVDADKEDDLDLEGTGLLAEPKNESDNESDAFDSREGNFTDKDKDAGQENAVNGFTGQWY